MEQTYLRRATIARIKMFVRFALDYKQMAKQACTVEYRERWEGQATAFLMAANMLGGVIRLDKALS